METNPDIGKTRLDHPQPNLITTLNQMSTNDLDQLKRDISTIQNKRTGFLRLPAELRNRIYESVLEDHFDNMPRMPFSQRNYRGNYSVHKEPAFCMTCRQIQAEGLSIFYGEFVDVQRYSDEAKAWTKLSFEEVCRVRPKFREDPWYARQTLLARPVLRIVL